SPIGGHAYADVLTIASPLELRRQNVEGAGGGQGQLLRSDAGARERLEHGGVLVGALAAEHGDQPGGGGALGKVRAWRSSHLSPPGNGGRSAVPAVTRPCRIAVRDGGSGYRNRLIGGPL